VTRWMGRIRAAPCGRVEPGRNLGGGAVTARNSHGSVPSGDDVRRSVASLFRAHWDELCGVAGGIVGSGDAEDVVMDVLTAVLRRAPEDPSIVTASYLFGAVRREARKVRRRRAYRRQRLSAWTDLQEVYGRTPCDPERVLERKERARVLHEALAVLPKGQREAFEARDVHGLSLREAADRLEKTESSVERQTSRARRRLREVLRSRGIASIDDIGRRVGDTDSA